VTPESNLGTITWRKRIAWKQYRTLLSGSASDGIQDCDRVFGMLVRVCCLYTENMLVIDPRSNQPAFYSNKDSLQVVVKVVIVYRYRHTLHSLCVQGIPTMYARHSANRLSTLQQCRLIGNDRSDRPRQYRAPS